MTHQKSYSTARATVKEAGTPSPRAVSQLPGSMLPQGWHTGPLPSRDPPPASRVGGPLAMAPARPHLPPLRAGPGPTVPQGEAEKQAWLLFRVLRAWGPSWRPTERTRSPREPRRRVASPGASEPAWTAAEAKPEPDQTQRRIWETFNKPHSPEDIVLTNSSAQNGFNLTPGNPGEQKLASEVLKGSGRMYKPVITSEARCARRIFAKFAIDWKNQKSRLR